jgi:hypothetical protein
MRATLLIASIVTAWSPAATASAEPDAAAAKMQIVKREPTYGAVGATSSLGRAGIALAREKMSGYGLSMLAPAPFTVESARGEAARADVFTSGSPGALPLVSVVVAVTEYPGMEPASWDLRGVCVEYIETLRSTTGSSFVGLSFADERMAGEQATTMRGKLTIRGREYELKAAVFVRSEGGRSQLIFVEAIVGAIQERADRQAALIVASLAPDSGAAAGEGSAGL